MEAKKCFEGKAKKNKVKVCNSKNKCKFAHSKIIV
jgi:hypothetical protein